MMARVRQDGSEVLLQVGAHSTVLPWDAAIELGRALIEQGHRAEEIAKAMQVIEDQAPYPPGTFRCDGGHDESAVEPEGAS